MAPTISKKRTSLRAKSAALVTSSGTTAENSRPHLTPTIMTKKDKRSKKLSAFLARIRKPEIKPKRRRPNKKLVTSMESLFDALPDLEKVKSDEQSGSNSKQLVFKSKPGAMKRKEELERNEKHRFVKNLALLLGTDHPQSSQFSVNAEKNVDPDQLAEPNPSNIQIISPATKFSALRAWANANLEKNPNFKQKS